MNSGFAIKTASGEFRQKHTAYCPKCGTRDPERTISGEQDFDEHGWYQIATLTCRAPACAHTWTEKVYISQPAQKLW